MKISPARRPTAIRRAVIWLVLTLMFWSAVSTQAGTVVKLGSIRQITGPDQLDLEGEIIYALNFSAEDPPRVVRGVTFLPDRQAPAGVTLVLPQLVSSWQTKPEFGSTPDDNQLEEIMHDIRWANAGSNERLRATLPVNPGEEYKLQILISGNGGEDRRWDIRVDGLEAVDEITSLGASPGQSYSQARVTLYTYEFKAVVSNVVVEMGNLFGANEGADRNPIWQALVLERTFIPPTPEDITLKPSEFFATQQSAVGAFTVLDRKSGTTHSLELVSGAGDGDNAKFTLSGVNLLPRPFDFSSQPAGSIYSVRIRATDTADPRRFMEKVFTVRITLPEPPVAILLDATSIETGARAGSLVSRVSVADPNPSDHHTLELVSGDGAEQNDYFDVLGSELRLKRLVPGELAQIRLRLRATDGANLSIESTFTLPALPSQVRINEVIASDVGGILDEQLEPQEWLELHNPLKQWVDLTGWYLTDRRTELKRWQFPRTVLAPNEFLIVLTDGRDTATPPGSTNLHANFSLDSGGEWLALIRPDGETIANQMEIPETFPGIAYGTGSNGSEGYLPKSTPRAANGETTEFGRNEVIFSQTHGFYDKAFTLELRATVPGSTIRYTIDGTRPTANSGLVYPAPINVSPNTTATTRGVRIVRALAVHPRAAYSMVHAHTYLFINGSAGPAVDGVVAQSQLTRTITTHAAYKDLIDDALLALPTLSVLLPQGPNAQERLGSIELVDPTGEEEGFQIECGINVTGTSSLASPKLSMAAKFRSKYGVPKLRYPVFRKGSMASDRAATEFKELRLRSHSHDTFHWLGTREEPPVPYGSPPVTRSGDAQYGRNLWIEQMQLLMNQPGKHGRQVHLYLNGAYHGIYHVHEHADEDFMASYYADEAEDYHYTGAAISGSEHSSGDSWRTAWSQLKASLGNYTQAMRWVDVTNLCDYMVLSFYAGNDWDWWPQHNWSAAGPRFPDRGGWKFFQQDSDISLQDVTADCTDQDVPDGVFNALMAHADFRVLFRDRVYKHCFNGGVLTPANAAGLYNDRMMEIVTAIIAETARWQPRSSVGTLPWDRNQEWTNEWRYLRDTFFVQRTDRLLNQIRARSGWWPADPPAANRQSGRVPAGFELTFTATSGVVYYTADGSDPRLPGGGISPTARRIGSGLVDGPIFTTGATWRYLDTGTQPPNDWKSRGFDDSLWAFGATEMGYGDGGEVTTNRFVDTEPGTPGVQKNITTYFRRTFDVPNFSALQSIKIRLVRDDGAVVYLNGEEIWRSNMPEGIPITPTTRALVGVGGADESRFFELTLAKDKLLPVDNVIAVEVHQSAPDSSDISFNLELMGLTLVQGTGLPIDGPTLAKARAFAGGDWSALREVYLVPEDMPDASATNLIISEIHYHPMDETANEFIEFLNTSTAPLDLSDVVLSEGVTFRFPRGSVLKAGERMVVVKDKALFAARYLTNTSPYFREGIQVVGPWTGSLANDGERIRIHSANGVEILSVAYGTRDAWPGRPDGNGSSLEVVSPSLAPLDTLGKSVWLSVPIHWRASSEFHGSPGMAGTGPDNRVVINEILAASIPPETDALELKNISSTVINVTGWFLSDSAANYRKYRFPAGRQIEPGGWLVLRENEFNNAENPDCLTPFLLDANGETVALVEADANGALRRFVDRVSYGPMPNGKPVGRSPDGTGPIRWLDMVTLGSENAAEIQGYSAWVATTFGLGASVEVAGPTADPDGDGLINLLEYAFVTSPNQPTASPLVISDWVPDGQFTFSFPTRGNITDLAYRVDVSTDLLAWDESEAELEVLSRTQRPDGSVLVSVRLRPNPIAQARFLRLMVLKQ